MTAPAAELDLGTLDTAVDAASALGIPAGPSSYAGSELGARVVEAAVARYEDPALLEHVDATGRRLGAGLDALIARRPDRLVARRGLGLMLALETHSPAQGLELTRQSFAHGLLALFAFNRQSTLQIMPPLVIAADEVDEVLERLDAAVEAMGPAEGP